METRDPGGEGRRKEGGGGEGRRGGGGGSPPLLTDVVVLVARAELEAQREGREELELLGELERAPGRRGPVALPALEAALPVVAGGVAFAVDHVQHLVLHALGRRQRCSVVRAVNVQVVVDAHLYGVAAAVVCRTRVEPEGGAGGQRGGGGLRDAEQGPGVG